MNNQSDMSKILAFMNEVRSCNNCDTRIRFGDIDCPHCQKSTKIFKGLGGKSESDRLNVPILGRIPLFADLAKSTDLGTPFVLTNEQSQITKEFNVICKSI